MWSRVLDTDLGRFTLARYDQNGLEYHNRDHILSMYDYMERTSVHYSTALDLAVLFHDVIYDSESCKEIRSADDMEKICSRTYANKTVEQAWYLIMQTSGHKLRSIDGLDIVKADLYGLTDPIQTIENFAKIQKENAKLYPESSVSQRLLETKKFMESFKITMMNNLVYDHEFFTKVIAGIDLTINLCVLCERQSNETR